MGFNNGNGFNSNNNNNQYNNNGGGNNQQPQQQKKNFPVGKLYGTDGIMDISIWNAGSAMFTLIGIKQSVGKDPANGKDVYEQKPPKELPRLFLYPPDVAVIIDVLDEIKDPGAASVRIEFKNKNVLTIVGDGSSVKFTLNDNKIGERSITFKGTKVGDKYRFGDWNLIKDYCKIAYEKGERRKLDPEEFPVNNDENM
jgi:hypothetical protein